MERLTGRRSDIPVVNETININGVLDKLKILFIG
jgi:hypothetical protein